MHRWHERNQEELTGYYDDLLLRHRQALAARRARAAPAGARRRWCATWTIPYVGSTELGTNMRREPGPQGGAHRASSRPWARRSWTGFDFSRPFNLIYGAGGFSGLLAGLVMSRLIDERQANIQRIYGCSAGVLNGLFHAVVLGARRRPDLYTAEAANGLADLEEFFQRISPSLLYSVNKTPRSLYRALVNFGPLRRELARYLERWTGRPHGEAITFQDIELPFYAAGARGSDGYLDIFGMPDGLEMEFAGRTLRPINCPIVDAIVGGMAQPFYITPPVIERRDLLRRRRRLLRHRALCGGHGPGAHLAAQPALWRAARLLLRL